MTPLETRLHAVYLETVRHLGQIIQKNGIDPRYHPQRQRVLDKLDRIEAALARLGDYHFGICKSCNQAIDQERLKMIPYVELCLSCQRQAELEIH